MPATRLDASFIWSLVEIVGHPLTKELNEWNISTILDISNIYIVDVGPYYVQ